MVYTALKPCSFAGQSFKIGELVPDEVIQPGAGKNLVKMGVLAAGEAVEAQTGEPFEPVDVVKVAIKHDGETIVLDVTADGIQDVFSVLTSKVAEVDHIIDNMDDPEALILLHASDSRKAVKEAAETRAKKLSESGEG